MKWPMIRLGEFATSLEKNSNGYESIPVYSISKHDGFVRSDEYFKKRVHSEDTSNYRIVAPGEIAFSPIHLDEGSIALAKEWALISPMYKTLSLDKHKCCGEYVIRILKLPSMIKIYGTLGDGSVHRRRSVPFSRLAEIKIPLPPLKEQMRIAEILDQADKLRRLRRQANNRTSELGQSIFNDMFGDPTTNPFGFESLPLGEIIEFIGGSQPPKSNFLYEDGPDRVRFVQTRDFRTDEYKTYVPKHLAKRPFSETDVMIGRYGPPVFQIFRGLSGTYNVALMKASPKKEITSDFVYYLLQEPRLHSFVVSNSERTAGQSGVNLDLLEKYPAYRPPMKLQLEFSRRIEIIQEQEIAQTDQTHFIDQLFESIQQRAFSGEL